MTDQPGDLINEAGKLFDAVLRRVVGGGSRDDENGRDREEHRDRGARPRDGADDAWASATAEPPRYATGAPECCHCPVCRTIAASRESGHEVGRHVREAGQSLLAAALDVVQGFDRTRPDANRNRPPRPRDASAGPGAGRSDRSGRSPRDEAPSGGTPRGERPREEPGDPWAAATGGDSIDIG
ncbi:hypothetical protein GCM10009527_044060 [Actinomadura nitritigenes]|uniref:Uncharacterized protein n=1 Tax=Actinomadura nitritigenes TaxID=134602 RepID=A0ABS3R6D0_9ACTN|nr:hypothetical protein [Actinomadura nitritigenes]MBO2441602.1 hypothetical protein [Actinomadura nitritigenes]